MTKSNKPHDWAAVLDIPKDPTVTTVAEVCRRMSIPRVTVNKYMQRHPDWAEEFRMRIVSNRGAKGTKLGQRQQRRVAERDAGFPDFIEARREWWRRKSFPFHIDAYKHIEQNQRLVMIVPPEHAKTTVWSIEYSAYKLITNPNLRIAVVQKSAAEARKVVQAVQQRLADEAWYANEFNQTVEESPIGRYGPFKPQREWGGRSWGAEAFMLATRTSGEKDPSMQAKGVTSAILGNRLDLVILDDIQDTDSQGPENVQKLLDKLQHEWLSRLGEHGKLIVLGSRIGPGDFYEAVMGRYCDPDSAGEYVWPLVKYPAITNEAKKRVLCPDLWSWEALARKKFEVGDKWYSNWMQEEVQIAGAAFNREKMLEARDYDLRLGTVPAGFEVVIGVDPAIAAYCAIAAWGVNPQTRHRVLVDIENRQGLANWPNVARLVMEMAHRYHARAIVVEWNNTQAALYEELRKDAVSAGISLLRYQTVTATGARAEETDFSISSVGALYNEGLISLPYADTVAQAKIDPYIAQCANWRPKPSTARSWHLVRDMVMATLFAESEARDIIRRGIAPMQQPKRRAPAWADSRYLRWKKERQALDLVGRR